MLFRFFTHWRPHSLLLLAIGLPALALAQPTAPIELFVQVNPAPPAHTYQWESNPNLVQIYADYFATGPMTVKISGQLINSRNEVVAEVAPGNAPEFTLQPGFNMISPVDIFTPSSIILLGNFERDVMRTGRLPGGEYELCFTFHDVATMQPVTEPACGFFFVDDFNLPFLIYPDEGAVIPQTELQNTVFQWSPIVFDGLSGPIFRLTIVEVLPFQGLEEAFLVNPPVLSEPVFEQPVFLWPENWLPLQPGTYGWGLELVDPYDETVIETTPPHLFTVVREPVTETDTFTVPPEEWPPIHSKPDECAGPNFESEKGTGIDLGAVLEDPSKFHYPRAVPLRAEGKDWDLVWAKCYGCDGGESKVPVPVPDDVNQFKWKLLSDKGSLNTPFDVEKINENNARREEIKKRLTEIEDSLAQIGTDTASTLPDKIAKLEASLDEVKKQIDKQDSLIDALHTRQDSLKQVLSERLKSIEEILNRLDSIDNAIAKSQQTIDSLNSKLNGEPSAEELQQLEKVKALRQQLENLRQQLLNKEQEIAQQAEQLLQSIEATKQALTAAGQGYNQLQRQAEAIAQLITSLETQLFANPQAREFMVKRGDWDRKATMFVAQYVAVPDKPQEFQQKQDVKKEAALVIGVPNQQERENRFNAFVPQINTLQSDLSSACNAFTGTMKSKCATAASNVDQARQSLVDELNQLKTTNYVFPVQTDKKIDSFRNELEQMEAQIASAKAAVAQADQAYQDALKNYEDVIAQLEQQKDDLQDQYNTLSDSLASAELKYKNLVQARIDSLDLHRQEYLLKLHEHGIAIDELQLKSERWKDSVQTLIQDTTSLNTALATITTEIEAAQAFLSNLKSLEQNLRDQIEAAKDAIEKLKERGKDLADEKDDLEEELEELDKDNEIKLTGNKTYTGPVVYYIPPPLEIIMQDNGTIKEFEEKKKKVEDAESELAAAYANKQALQGKLSKLIDDISKALAKFKQLQDQIAQLEEQAKNLDVEVNQLKAEKQLKYQQLQLELQNALAKSQQSKQIAEQKKAQAEQDSTSLADLLEKTRQTISLHDSSVAELTRLLVEKKNELDYEEGLFNNAKNTLREKAAELDAAKLELEALKSKLSRLKHDLTRASATEDNSAFTSTQQQVQQTEAQVKTQETKVEGAETAIASLEGTLQGAETRVNTVTEQFNNFEEAKRFAQNELKALKDSLIERNERFESALSALKHWKKEEERLQENIDKINSKRSEVQDKIANKLNEDEEVKSKADQLAGIKQQIEDTKTAQKDQVNKINDALNKKKELEKEAEDKLKKAKQDLEDRQKELKDFVKDQFDAVTFEVKIELKGKDSPLDGYRKPDDEATLVSTLKYINGKPSFDNKRAQDNQPQELPVVAVCVPSVDFEKKDPAQKAAPPSAGPEPRTIAMIYQNGKLLWKEWPVIPEGTPLIAKDAVPVTASFSGDPDDMDGACTGGDCEPTMSKPPIADLLSYVWSATTIVDQYELLNVMLWEPDKVPLPLPQEEKEIKVNGAGRVLAADDFTENKGKIPVKPGVMIEVTDSIIGTPDTVLEVQARVVTGDHKGLDGETIEFSFIKKDGHSEEYKFEDGDTLVEKTTDADGYAKAKFNFGDGFAEFEFYVKWKRGDEILAEEVFPGRTPVRTQFLLFASTAPGFAWDKGKELFEKGGNQSEASVKSAVAGFPSSTEEGGEDAYALGIHAIAGLVDEERDFVNAKKIDFEIEGKAKIDPESDSTELIGIARTLVEPEDKEEEGSLKVTAKVDEIYEPLGRPAEDNSSYSTGLIKEFQIGSESDLFTIILDEPAQKGSPISGTGKFGISATQVGEVFTQLKEIKLHVNNIEVDDDGEIAKAGSVSWKAESPFHLNILSFKLDLDSLVVTASLGAGIGGKFSHSSLTNKVPFYAEFEATGDFIGRIDSLPGISISGFKLKEGTAVTIDMHISKSVPGRPNNFTGVYIHQAHLELPPAFNGKADKQPTKLTATGFYIGSSGVGGKVEMEQSFFKTAFAGYELEAEKVLVELEDNSVKAASFTGKLFLAPPFEGKIKTTIALSGEQWLAQISTESPIAIPRLSLNFSLLEGTGLEYDLQKELGTLKLSAIVTSKHFGQVTVLGMEANSNGEIKTEKIDVNQPVKFGSGFDMVLESLSFAITQEEYSLGMDGSFSFPKIGIDQLEGGVSLAPGPAVSVTLKAVTIEFDRDPVSFKGNFAYSGREFQGDFTIGIKKILPQGISGVLIVGNIEDGANVTYNYWYCELAVGTKIPLGQTGLVLLQMGGGLGYNYSPPIGTNPGAPTHNDGFALKALVAMGSAPGGEVFTGRMEMVLQPGSFSLYGKVWLLQQEENIFGDGQLTLYWAPEAKLDGYMQMFVGLPNVEGDVFLFRGKINYLYGPQEAYVKSEFIDGSFLKAVNAEASVDVNSQHVKLGGRLYYNLEERFPLGVVDVLVALNVDANGNFSYIHASSTLNANANFTGEWDVDLDTPLGVADIVSGHVILQLAMTATPAYVEVAGKADVAWDVWVYADSVELDVGYKVNI